MGQDLQEIVDAVSTVLDAPAVLEDRDFNLVAFHTQLDEIDAVRAGTILRRKSTSEVREWFEQFGIATAPDPVRTPADTDLGIMARLCVPVRWNGVTYGYFWVLDPAGRTGTPPQLEAATALANEAGAVLAQRVRGSQDASLLLDDLLSPDDRVVARAADDLDNRGLAARTAAVAVVHVQLPQEFASTVVPLNLWTLPRHVVATSGEGGATLLVTLDTSHDQAGDLSRAIAAGERLRRLYAERLGSQMAGRVVVGVGSPGRGLEHARVSHEQARLAAQVCASVPSVGPVACWTDLGVFKLLACGPRDALVQAVIDPRAQRLLDHGGPDLLRTARAFLDRGGAIQQVAADLSVHRQTAYYRIGRIEQVTGLDLSRGDDRLVLHLALTLAPVLRPALA